MTDRQKPSQLIPPHGDYRDLQSYKRLEIVYDATLVFCDRFISKQSRTHDQMVQEVQRGKEDHVRDMISRCFNPGSGLLQA